MSLQPFPEIINVKNFFSRQENIRASLSLPLFRRFEQYLNKDKGNNSPEVEVELDFIQDDENRLIVDAKMTGTLFLSCQRCLQALKYTLSSNFRVRVIEELKVSGDRELASDELDVVLSRGGKLDLLALVEDELILSLPLVIYHDEADCNQILIGLQVNSRQRNESKVFAELEVLKPQFKPDKVEEN